MPLAPFMVLQVLSGRTTSSRVCWLTCVVSIPRTFFSKQTLRRHKSIPVSVISRLSHPEVQSGASTSSTAPTLMLATLCQVWRAEFIQFGVRCLLNHQAETFSIKATNILGSSITHAGLTISHSSHRRLRYQMAR